jgi:hypothetical protein
MKCRTHIQALSMSVVIGSVALSSQLVYAGKKFDLDETRWVSVGAGIRTEFNAAEDAAPSGDDNSTDFDVSSIRLYLSGQAHEYVKFTFNTEKIDDDVDVLDAIVQLELSPQLNVWMGRMLTPADRIEMNGPYYALSWNQYTVPLYASDQGGEAGRIGRDDGMTVWGAVEKFQYAVGVFDGLEGGANTEDNLLYAARLAYNFLNMEKNPGYYTSSTYYGGLGDIFTVGLSLQSQEGGVGSAANSGDFFGYAVDVLYEGVLDSGDVVTVESEYKDFESDVTAADLPANADCFCLFDGDAYFVTAAYLFNQPTGVGKLQPYLRYTENSPNGADTTDLTELGLNYVISGHNLRFNVNFSSGDIRSPGDDVDAFTVGMQLQI